MDRGNASLHTELDSAHHSDTVRLEAFSDGVFAIAITLLILEIGVPDIHEGQSLGAAMRTLWPSYIGFALSFLTIGIMWSNHHGMFKEIARVDDNLVVLNLLLLLCVSFLPFPTAVLAHYMRNDSQALAATLAYGISFTLTAIIFNSVWIYASWHRRLIDDHISDSRVRARTRRYLIGPPLYALGILLAFANPWLGLGVWITLAIVYLLPIRE